MCVSPWGFLKKSGCWGKVRGVFIDRRFNSGYYVWPCQVRAISIKEGIFPNSTFLSTLCISENGGKYRGVCETKLVAMHLGPNCLDLASMSNKPGADWTTEKQIDLSLVHPLSDKFSGILADIISVLCNFFNSRLPHCLMIQATWKELCSNHDLMFEKIIPNLLRNFEKFLILCPSHL